MIKKIVVLASMALALVAMAAPAAQAGTKWSNEGLFEFTGEITSERGGLVTGPAVVHLQVELINGPEHGEGFVVGGEITGHVPTNLPGCVATGTLANLPWPITLTTPDTVDIGRHDNGINETVTFENHYESGGAPGCPAFGVPSTVPVAGIVTGTVENGENEVCINLNTKLDDMHIEPNVPGTVDLTTPTEDLCAEGVEA